MWISPWQLSAHGVLGINRRNCAYISRYNDRRLYPLVDNKLKTKLIAEEYGVATPKLHFVVERQYDINRIEKQLLNWDKFAIKPAKGSGGKGIWVIVGKNGDRFVKASGLELTVDDLHRHMSNTLAGVYSLAGTPDVVIIEDLIIGDDSFKDFSYEGVPDIRVIIFQGYPVMAMIRLATHASDGKANLHQGAVGVGIDIATGKCLNAVQFSKRIETHPDTGRNLKEIHIECWQELLLLASRCYEMTGLGYIGVDMVIDKYQGPQLLELNARPGLAIQIANGLGLLPRLQHIEALSKRHRTAEHRVEYAQSVFNASNSK